MIKNCLFVPSHSFPFLLCLTVISLDYHLDPFIYSVLRIGAYIASAFAQGFDLALVAVTLSAYLFYNNALHTAIII